MGIEQTPQRCKALAKKPHPATRRSGYCEKHHRQYDQAMAAYRSAVYNYRHGRTQTKPPVKAQFIKSIRFTDVETVWAVIEGADKEFLLRALRDLNRDSLFLTQLIDDPEPLYDLNTKLWKDDLIRLQGTVQRVTIVLAGLVGKHPDAT